MYSILTFAFLHAHPQELGIEAPAPDIDKLFDDIDEDNSGTLELVELKQ